jgi:hypothetical protein
MRDSFLLVRRVDSLRVAKHFSHMHFRSHYSCIYTTIVFVIIAILFVKQSCSKCVLAREILTRVICKFFVCRATDCALDRIKVLVSIWVVARICNISIAYSTWIVSQQFAQKLLVLRM